ncbi:Hemolysin-type calcium-binding repeat-containing protein [Gemmobacter aquatilis]|uniref:Hemolysin-type calcium-binding repeat-containing protein n=1 Tax=Gemmobacter aquatilis TaxID=933059 RepID=A0A1H8FW90_9RHOB|nr:calcium-binding protein [Gemmobacter aquatilis]SEN36023.1 Hemolysin-type calcium-binding repeat-containing protein [Gemmobacter aquatilis]
MSSLTALAPFNKGFDVSLFLESAFSPAVAAAPDDVSLSFAGKRIALIGEYEVDTVSKLATGTVTGFEIRVVGQPVVTITVEAVAVADVLNFLADADGRAFFATTFAGDDVMAGSDWRDNLLGFKGADQISAGEGNDTLGGGIGDDRLLGEGGFDALIGDAGQDTLLGGFGNDTLLGGTGNDRLLGGGADDRLEGGAGADQLRGNAGTDYFVFRGNFGRDILGDMTMEDRIILGAGFWAGMETAADVLEAYATVRNGNTFIELDGRSILLRGWTDLEALATRLGDETLL